MATTEPSACVMEIDCVTTGYGDLPAVRDISLRLHEGEIVALFGLNGAGKSTTLSAAMGELPCWEGQVRWWNTRRRGAVHQLARSGVAYVPEARCAVMSMTVRENLLLGRGGVDPALAYFPELVPLLERKAGLLSGGEQQMLVLGRALAMGPKVLIADELTLGLAPVIVDRLFLALQQARAETDVAVLLVEQQARRALAVASRWYLLRSGRIVAAGESAQGVEALEAGYLS